MKKLSLILALMIITGPASSNGELTGEVTQQSEHKPQLHAVSSEKVREIMQNLYTLVHKDEFTKPEEDEMREEYMSDLVAAVEELLISTEMMATGLPEPDLDENEIVTFRALAGQLYSEAQNIQSLSEYYDYRVIDSAYKRLNQTCAACHDLFRDR